MSAPECLEQIQGSLERIVYSNEENHYTVGQLLPENERKTVTITGNLPAVQCGETLRLHGEWVTHPQFGRQFKIARFESILPSTITGLKKYLGSGLIRGIGPKFAERIVDFFGKETLTVIDQYSGRLKEVPGIGAERAGRIRLAWVEQKAVREIMIFLQSYGITPSQAAKIYRMYGDDSMKVVKDNPYQLARDIHGIGFRTADQIARNLGIPSDSAQRIQAGIVYQLEQILAEGHTCYPFELLTRAASGELLGVEEGPVERHIAQLVHEGALRLEPDENLVFLAGIHRAERGLAERLLALARAPVALPAVQVEKALAWADQQSHITMSDAQREAVRAAITSKLVVITGGPGVGKTTIVRGIVKILAYKKARIALCAPTGRAAKRLSESCSFLAQTIHRLLKYDPQNHGFIHDAARPIEADLVVVDETSMLDVPLAYHLFNAISPTASVVLVGDADQLPSVGPGNFLRDVIESGIVSVIRLNQIFRQHHRSQIVVNAHRVNEGHLPENSATTPMLAAARDLDDEDAAQVAPDEAPEAPEAPRVGVAPPAAGLTTASDFHLLPAATPDAAIERIIQLVSEEIPRAFKFDPIEDIQVMAPMHRGVCGVENLNRRLQAALNPKRPDPKFRLHRDGVAPEIERFGRLYRIGDKVMQIRNNYDKDVFNGDLGRIVAIDRDAAKLSVRVDDRLVEYEFNDLDELLPAYAISIHKSQGSEYPVVVLPILTQHYVMLQRNLLYTAITRGKKLVIVVGTAKALALAVRNEKTAQRYGMLKARLAEKMEAGR
ncbi:MAG: AAA family ATPase [Verrucomicrobiae bacterium]|nr:AAA family ATPase [Verrucomicrobiae bacterium]